MISISFTFPVDLALSYRLLSKVTSGTLFLQVQEIIHYDRLVGLAAGDGPSPAIFPQMIAVY